MVTNLLVGIVLTISPQPQCVENIVENIVVGANGRVRVQAASTQARSLAKPTPWFAWVAAERKQTKTVLGRPRLGDVVLRKGYAA